MIDGNGNEIEEPEESITPFNVGDYVEKHTGEARYFGWIVGIYLTRRGSLRFVVEIDPQGFQMIVAEAQIRMAD